MIHFDFDDRYQDENVVGSAITRRDGVALSIVFHGLLAAALIVAPQLSIFQLSPEELERRRALLERIREATEQRRFVFVQPRVDVPAEQPRERFELSDENRIAQAPLIARIPENPLPFSSGNSAERVEEELPERARGAEEPPQPEPEPAPEPAAPEEELPVPTPMFAGAISLERSIYSADEPVRVTFRDFRGDERIVVANVDAEFEEYIAGVWPDGTRIGGTPPATLTRDGSVAFLGFDPGDYEVRVFTGSPEDGEWPQLTEIFTVESSVEAATPTEGVAPPDQPQAGSDADARPQRDRYTEGEPIVVDFRGFPGYAQDWIDISPMGASEESYGQWFYLGGETAGSLQFAGLPAGTYEVRGRFNWPDGGYAVRTRSTFTVVSNQPPAAQNPQPTAVSYRVTGLSAAWIGTDADVVSPITVSPDGAADGHFSVDMAFEGEPLVSYVTVYSSDANGNPSGGQVWHTQNSSYAVLAAAAWGHLLNDGYAGEIGRFSDGATRLDLYAFDSGWFQPGQHFVVEVGFADGQKVARVVQLTGGAAPSDTAQPPSVQYRVTGLSATWIGIDADVVSTGTATTPDGAADGRLSIEIALEGSVELRYVTLFSSDAQGNSAGGQVWTTSTGTNYWVLGVGAGGRLLHTGQVESLGQLQSGTTYLDLFAGNSGWFNPGQTFVVELGFADGQRAAQVVQVTGAAAPPATPPPSAESAAGATTIDWYTGPMAHRGQNGQRFSYLCPPNGAVGPLWGTGVHTDDSSVCTAAVHAGLITFASGGTVTIEIRPGRSSYTGSAGQGGVTSRDWGAYEGSFMVVGGEGGAPSTPTGAGLPTQDFYAPIWNGMRLDWCLVWGGQCGEPAATEFCRQSGYTRAIAWEPAVDVGVQTPTYVLGTGQVCNEPGCDAFASITCAQ